MWQPLLDGLSVLGEKWILVLSAVCLTCLGCSVCYLLSRDSDQENKRPWQSLLLSGSFFILSVIPRLAFLKEAFVPPYFDSVEHYRIIKVLVTALETSTLPESIPALTASYYHLGFHFLASFLTFGLHADPMDVILVLGQVVLAGIPIPIFFLLYRETQSVSAAVFGMLLAGFGWYMPGFAVNWGKYPALAGLLALEIAVSIAYFIDRNRSLRSRTTMFGVLILGIWVSTVFHTRTLFIIVISVVSWLLAARISTLSKISQYILLFFLFAGMLVFGNLILAEPILRPSLDPFLEDGLWVTLTILALSPFALTKSSQGFYFCLLFVLCVFAALFLPVGAWSPELENQTLLDRPFVEMVLYLPLSILGGLGLAGLLQTLTRLHVLPDKMNLYARMSVAILLVSLTGLLSIERYDFYPSDCCNFVGHDDTIAIDWLDRNLPPDARILIAATQMTVLPAGPSANLVGTDAGMWIPALAGRDTALMPFDIDFRDESTLDQLCQMQVDHVYIGGTDQRFNVAQLNEKRDWYKGILLLPTVQLYQVTGCSK